MGLGAGCQVRMSHSCSLPPQLAPDHSSDRLAGQVEKMQADLLVMSVLCGLRKGCICSSVCHLCLQPSTVRVSWGRSINPNLV